MYAYAIICNDDMNGVNLLNFSFRMYASEN